ncbi:MAG: HEAT repeat domain-containing protein [Planctomycetota bacterium]
MKQIKLLILAGICLAAITLPFAGAHEDPRGNPGGEFNPFPSKDGWVVPKKEEGSTGETFVPPSVQIISQDYILYESVYNLIPLIGKKSAVLIDTGPGTTKRRLVADETGIDFIYSYVIPFDTFLLSDWDGIASSVPETDKKAVNKTEEFNPSLNFYFRRLLMTNFVKLAQLSMSIPADNYPSAQLAEYLIEIGQPSLIITQALRQSLAGKKPPKKGLLIPEQIIAECVEKAVDVPALQPASGALTATDCFVTTVNRLIVEELSKDYYYQSHALFARHLRTLGEPAIPYVIEAAKNNAHSLIRRNAVSLLGFYDTPGVRPVLRALLKSPDKVTRNRALLALIDKTDSDIVPFLIETLKTGDDDYFKTLAAYALGQLKDKRAVKPLMDYAGGDPNNTDVLWTVLPALGKIGDNSDEVIKFLNHFVEWKRSPITKTWALLSLMALKDEKAAQQLKLNPSASDPFKSIAPANRYFALKVFGARGGEYIPILLELAKNKSWDTRFRLTALCHIKFGAEHIPQLKDLLEEDKMPAIIKAYALYVLFLLDDPDVCQYAQAIIKQGFSALGKANLRLDGEGLDSVIAMQILGKSKLNTVPLLKDIILAEYNRAAKIKAPQKDIEFLVPTPPVMETAIQELGRIPDAKAGQELVNLLRLEDFPCRAEIAMALKNFGEKPVIEALIKALSDEDGWTRYCAYRSLNKITAKDFNCEWCFDPPKERQSAVKIWEKWWKEEQSRPKGK